MKISWQKRIKEENGGGTASSADSHASWQPDGCLPPLLYEHQACRRSREHSNMRRVGFFFALVLIATLFGCSGGTADTDPHEPLENPEPMGYTLTIISSTAGGSIIIPGEGNFTYDVVTVVDLVAEVEPGYQFVNWTGDVDTIVDPDSASTNITTNDDYSITANFEPLLSVEYSLTINSTEGGEVTTPGEGTFTCDAGKVVNLLAVADEHYEFTCWTGDVDHVDDIYAAETTITVWDDYSITANFEKVPAPEVYSVEPNSGQPKDQLTVTIFGANFKDRPSVDFGERIVVQQVTFVSASQLEVRIVVHNLAELGLRDVTVTNPDGQSATLPDGFTVL
jgi:uncharacterized repeat protein (TIGR02543 family)